MKHIITLLAVASLALVGLPSCSSSGSLLSKEQAGALTSFAIDYAVKSGKISEADAVLIRDVKTVILPTNPPPLPPTSAKGVVPVTSAALGERMPTSGDWLLLRAFDRCQICRPPASLTLRISNGELLG